MNYPAAGYGVPEGICFACFTMTRSTLRRAQGRPEDDRGATKLRVMDFGELSRVVKEIEP